MSFNHNPRWIEMLPEVGQPVLGLADQYDNINEQIKEHEKCIATLKEMKKALHARIDKEATKFWTPEEIRQAKILYRNKTASKV